MDLISIGEIFDRLYPEKRQLIVQLIERYFAKRGDGRVIPIADIAMQILLPEHRLFEETDIQHAMCQDPR